MPNEEEEETTPAPPQKADVSVTIRKVENGSETTLVLNGSVPIELIAPLTSSIISLLTVEASKSIGTSPTNT